MAIAICYQWVDRPVAFFVHDRHVEKILFFKWLTYPPPIVQTWSPLVLALAMVRRAWGPLAHWQWTLFVACLSLIVADEFRTSLGDLCGRYWPETWFDNNPSLIGNGVYGFHPFQAGDDRGSFPSGHAARILGFRRRVVDRRAARPGVVCAGLSADAREPGGDELPLRERRDRRQRRGRGRGPLCRRLANLDGWRDDVSDMRGLPLELFRQCFAVALDQIAIGIDEQFESQAWNAEVLPGLEGAVEQDRKRNRLALPDMFDERLQLAIQVGDRLHFAVGVDADRKDFEAVAIGRMVVVEGNQLGNRFCAGKPSSSIPKSPTAAICL